MRLPKQIIQTDDAPQALAANSQEEWLRWFPNNPPARQGAKLPITPKGMKLSIAVIAAAS